MSDSGNQGHDFPRRLGRPATSALLAAGYTRLDQLTAVTTKEILALHGMGPKGIRIQREVLAEQGKAFEAE
jgi:predicted flap endonuclease-1-like 5' DNA nuclease